ncbi:hypothetical protein G9C98_000213 [Cotesia typhae]|uniref:mannosyl-oligosaccharide 1,3-1,6-alpha-mannosidase n=1 Tax=Cotesia typhae TaxID=2053667 RepID=A0A8J5R590_9HYME|nr:hypothetical protein G9C98_000213 [Cotesia typhae]
MKLCRTGWGIDSTDSWSSVNPFARKYIPEEITPWNLVERATTLLDQYRKKAQLYRSNVLLVPLGDDFRYTTSDEWDAQFNNYQRLFDYMNENKLFHVDVTFGTLTDYFNSLRNDLDIDQLPSLSGDFFTYADKNEDYWSGYYTSRPFYKRLDRVLIDALRGVEVILSIAWAYGFYHLVEGNFEKRITEARQWHSLFQHHDAVHLLRTSEDLILEPESVYLTLDQIRSHHTSIDDKQVLSFSDNDNFKRVVIYNSLPRKRERVQTLFVSTSFVKVTDSYGEPIQSQISPIWTEAATFSYEHYELSFVVTVAGFGLNTYLIHSVKSDNKLPSHVNIANITLFNAKNQPYRVPGFENIKIVSSPQEFSIRQRPEISAHFSKSGLLKSLQTGDTTASVDVEFVTYETDTGGAYLFIPNKPDPDPIYTTDDHVIHLITGPILSRVFIQLPQMIKRQKFSKLPTQANYYPLPSVGYIQDNQMRLTVVTGQPLGAASMASGQFEIMQDRRLIQEDHRGLGQGVTDNLLTNHLFMFVLEKKKPSCSSSSVNHPAGVLSVGGLLASEKVLHPLIAMHPNSSSSDSDYDYKDHFTPLSYDLPIDLTVANLCVFSIPESYSRGIGIILHR